MRRYSPICPPGPSTACSTGTAPSSRCPERKYPCTAVSGSPAGRTVYPQFNPEFNKRHLAAAPTPAYLREFLEVTCHAEVIHELIALLGFLSLFFCLLCEHPLDWLPLFFWIALFIGLCNLPFAAIQRYNRFRLVRLLGRMEAKSQVRS